MLVATFCASDTNMHCDNPSIWLLFLCCVISNFMNFVWFCFMGFVCFLILFCLTWRSVLGGFEGKGREKESLIAVWVLRETEREREMGRLFVITLEGSIYCCKHCKTHLALSDDIMSKVFASLSKTPLLIDLFALFFF